tara:strand:- start:11203 stop:12132 length:930 start_codon:yes stop_codon:yes gene_type:complete
VNKAYTISASENWVCDRFLEEWNAHNQDLTSTDISICNTVWLIAGWVWNRVPLDILKSKRVILTIHHIVPEKFSKSKKEEFIIRDQFVDLYHVPCNKTRDQISSLTSKPIHVIPFWANQNLWFPINEKEKIREKYKIDKDSYLIGSFQRDTEGSDLVSPKLEKGPDLFCDYVEKISKEKENVKVLLSGWRRQYVISRLERSNIDYYYLELPSFKIINELYNSLDLYAVTARHEGGPQSIIECALSQTPIVSTDVGIASSILSSGSIFNDSWQAIPNVNIAYENVQKITIPRGFKNFREMILGDSQDNVR